MMPSELETCNFFFFVYCVWVFFFFNLFIYLFFWHFLTDSDTKHIFITFNYLNEQFIDDKTDIIHHSAQGQL